MTEPVAYRVKNTGGMNWQTLDHKPKGHYDFIEPLYTAEQLHPRMKMTQAEFDEWKRLYEDTVELSLTTYRLLNEILYSKNNTNGEYNELSKRVYQENDSVTISKNQSELAGLFIRYNPDNPEETIEIVPTMKWFVRSKEPRGEDEDEYYLFLSGYNLYDLEYFPFNVNAKQFDTKEEAERWENPLTEAVLLPIEGNDI